MLVSRDYPDRAALPLLPQLALKFVSFRFEA